MTTAQTKPHCDCLNSCGDDPRVRKGEVESCDYRKGCIAQREQQDKDIARMRRLVKRLRNGAWYPSARQDADALERLRGQINQIYVP